MIPPTNGPTTGATPFGTRGRVANATDGFGGATLTTGVSVQALVAAVQADPSTRDAVERSLIVEGRTGDIHHLAKGLEAQENPQIAFAGGAPGGSSTTIPWTQAGVPTQTAQGLGLEKARGTNPSAPSSGIVRGLGWVAAGLGMNEALERIAGPAPRYSSQIAMGNDGDLAISMKPGPDGAVQAQFTRGIGGAVLDVPVTATDDGLTFDAAALQEAYGKPLPAELAPVGVEGATAALPDSWTDEDKSAYLALKNTGKSHAEAVASVEGDLSARSADAVPRDGKAWAAEIRGTPRAEQRALITERLTAIASENGWTYDSRVSGQSGRTVFADHNGNFWSIDMRHGTFEKHDANGTHLGEFRIDGTQRKGADNTGGHDLKMQ